MEQLRTENVAQTVADVIQSDDGGFLGVAGRVVGGPDHDYGVRNPGRRPDPDTRHKTPAVGPRQRDEQYARDGGGDVGSNRNPGAAVLGLVEENCRKAQ